MSINENGKRQAVFLALVEQDCAMTPSEIGNEIDESRQTVKYHLDQLVGGGLVVRDGDAYRCQPVFTDPEFEDLFVNLLANLVPRISERIDLDDGYDAQDRAIAVFNVLRMFIALEMLGPADDESETDG